MVGYDALFAFDHRGDYHCLDRIDAIDVVEGRRFGMDRVTLMVENWKIKRGLNAQNLRRNPLASRLEFYGVSKEKAAFITQNLGTGEISRGAAIGESIRVERDGGSQSGNADCQEKAG